MSTTTTIASRPTAVAEPVHLASADRPFDRKLHGLRRTREMARLRQEYVLANLAQNHTTRIKYDPDGLRTEALCCAR